MQLEKIIGKVKSDKYGVRILEEIREYCDFGTSEEEEDEEEEPSEERTKKRSRNHKTTVVIESSDENE